MPKVLGIATPLGLLGVLETFDPFYLATSVFHLNHDVIQSLIYLKLSISGHLTIFITRTRGPFWSIRPASLLLGAVLCTACLGYTLFWFLVEDRLKLVVYRIFDHFKGAQRERAMAE